jgi:hypothetical protein
MPAARQCPSRLHLHCACSCATTISDSVLTCVLDRWMAMLHHRRRALRSRWYELADAAEAAAEEAARQAEVHAWKSQGAAVKVRACVRHSCQEAACVLNCVHASLNSMTWCLGPYCWHMHHPHGLGMCLQVNLAGDVMDTATPMRMRHSPHKAPLQLSPKKRPSPMRSSGIGSCSSSTYTPLAAGAGATPIRSSTAATAASTPQSAAAAAAQHTPSSRGAAASCTPDAAAARTTPSSVSKAKAPAPLQIYEREIGCDENVSDIESPSRLDSPSKAAKSAAAAAAAAAPASKKQGVSSSPTKAYSKSQSLSLRGSRSAAVSASASPRAAEGPRAAGFTAGFEQQGRSGSPAAGITAEASWGTVSRSSTPGQQHQLRGSRSSAGQQYSAGKAGVAAGMPGGGSPAKRAAQGTPPGAGSGSRMAEDYSGYHASGYGAGVAAAGVASRGGEGGSPTKSNRAGKLSLRKPASHY